MKKEFKDILKIILISAASSFGLIQSRRMYHFGKHNHDFRISIVCAIIVSIVFIIRYIIDKDK